MIRVTVEMVPGGVGKPRHMATIEIANNVGETLSSGGRRGSYVGRFSRISQRGEHLGFYDRVGMVSGISRTTSGAVYRIIHGVLADFLQQPKRGQGLGVTARTCCDTGQLPAERQLQGPRCAPALAAGDVPGRRRCVGAVRRGRRRSLGRRRAAVRPRPGAPRSVHTRSSLPLLPLRQAALIGDANCGPDNSWLQGRNLPAEQHPAGVLPLQQ